MIATLDSAKPTIKTIPRGSRKARKAHKEVPPRARGQPKVVELAVREAQKSLN